MSFTILLATLPGFGQSEFAAGGYDVLRIENEIKLTVPDGMADPVWSYLRATYDNDGSYLKGIDGSFNCTVAVDSFIDQYFDTGKLGLLRMNSGVRHRSRFVLTDSTSRKDGRELMQIKVDGPEDDELSRGEYKYRIKRYKHHDEELDSHPFFGMVKRKHRDDIMERLEGEFDVDAMELRPTIRIVQVRRRIYVLRDTVPFATLTLDNVVASYEGKEARFTELELELNEIGYTENDPAGRKEMERINAIMKADLMERFPSIAQDQTPKYNKAAAMLGLSEASFPKEPMPIGRILWAIGAILVLAMAIPLARRFRRTSN